MEKYVDLNGTWKLGELDPGEGEKKKAYAADFDDEPWLPGQVPGNVHTALLRAGRIQDPFYHMNAETCRWVEECEWWYRTAFEGPSEKGAGVRHWLVFDGLDTLCTVYLNGEELGHHENMFVPVRFDVTDRLRLGRNVVALRFDPIPGSVGSRRVEDQWALRAPERALIRKAQYHFGWDWAPRLPTIGPWQGVRLVSRREGCIANAFFQTQLITSDGATAEVAVDVETQWWAEARVQPSICSGESGPLDRRLEIEVNLARGPQRLRAVTDVLNNGRATVALSVPDPSLWWTRELGAPALYELEVILLDRGRAVDKHRERVGIRTITWDQSPDPDEPGAHFFTPVLNGMRVFAKGADWTPADSFLSEIEQNRYRDLLEYAADAHMNMLRVWGGGVYEKDVFYELCDELGILVWQDFMYACALYPDNDPAFFSEAEREASEVIRRLRNHPCIALWCGNNENDWLDGLKAWPQPRDFPGKRICHELLPHLLAELDPSRQYWPSSPYGGDDHNDASIGDRHNWHVWHGWANPRRFGQRPQVSLTPEGVSYRHYAEDPARFVSEFGMHASPELETLRRNVPPSELYPGSVGMEYRYKDDPKGKGNTLMEAHTGIPGDMAQYIDFSMIAQAEGLKFAVEHYRRRKPHCSGALFWSLNDCWPGVSCSVLDYYLLPKAGYYYIKRAFAPLMASFKPVRDGFELWLVNDTLDEYQDNIIYGLGRFTGEALYREQLEISIPPNSARQLRKMHLPDVGRSPSTGYLFVVSGRNGFPSNRTFLTEVKDLHRAAPVFQVERLPVSEHEIEVKLLSSQFVYYVRVECAARAVRLSDNYLDLFPGIQTTVRVCSALGGPITPEDIAVTALPA